MSVASAQAYRSIAKPEIIDRPTSVLDFMSRAVYTKDEARGAIRPFPADKEYIQAIVEARDKCPIFAIEKSRRMLVSWTFCCIYLYDTLTIPNHANYIASRKLESSCELVGRLVSIYRQIPSDVWPGKPEVKLYAGPQGKGFKRLEVPSIGSFCEGVAEGRNQLRQYTASNILCDEFAFWQDAEGSWGALKPTIEGGGHIDMVSTPELGSFMFSLLYEDLEV